MYSPAERPSSRRPAPAKKRMLSEQTGISSAAYDSGLPTFCDSICASSSVCSSITSATLSSTSARSPGVFSRHSGSALAAALTARSTSASVPFGTSAIPSPVAGLRICSVPPSTASTHSPPTKFLYAATVTLIETSSSPAKRISLLGAGCRCNGPSRGDRFSGQPLGDPDGYHREQDHDDRDDVDDRQLLRPGQIREDPDRERLLGAGRERRDDHLVEGEREGQQSAGQERGLELRKGHVAKRLPRVGAEIRRGLLEERGGAPESGDDVV